MGSPSPCSLSFQFQTGAIKSSNEVSLKITVDDRFNSKLVRLKALALDKEKIMSY